MCLKDKGLNFFFFFSELSSSQREVLEQAAQRDCGCSVPGGVQDQIVWGHGQPGLVPDLKVGVPAMVGEL